MIEKATLAGGCFWCLEAIFSEVEGVKKIEPGYSGGKFSEPTYEQVCTGTTGHAEVVQISFEPEVISFRELLKIFFSVHNPTTLNRQGEDVGTQYRSAIFYHSEEQKATAEKVILEVQQEWDKPVVTELVSFKEFYVAEKYHHNYFKKNPEQAYCRTVIAPKLKKFKEE